MSLEHALELRRSQATRARAYAEKVQARWADDARKETGTTRIEKFLEDWECVDLLQPLAANKDAHALCSLEGGKPEKACTRVGSEFLSLHRRHCSQHPSDAGAGSLLIHE